MGRKKNRKDSLSSEEALAEQPKAAGKSKPTTAAGKPKPKPAAKRPVADSDSDDGDLEGFAAKVKNRFQFDDENSSSSDTTESEEDSRPPAIQKPAVAESQQKKPLTKKEKRALAAAKQKAVAKVVKISDESESSESEQEEPPTTKPQPPVKQKRAEDQQKKPPPAKGREKKQVVVPSDGDGSEEDVPPKHRVKDEELSSDEESDYQPNKPAFKGKAPKSKGVKNVESSSEESVKPVVKGKKAATKGKGKAAQGKIAAHDSREDSEVEPPVSRQKKGKAPPQEFIAKESDEEEVRPPGKKPADRPGALTKGKKGLKAPTKDVFQNEDQVSRKGRLTEKPSVPPSSCSPDSDEIEDETPMKTSSADLKKKQQEKKKEKPDADKKKKGKKGKQFDGSSSDDEKAKVRKKKKGKKMAAAESDESDQEEVAPRSSEKIATKPSEKVEVPTEQGGEPEVLAPEAVTQVRVLATSRKKRVDKIKDDEAPTPIKPIAIEKEEEEDEWALEVAREDEEAEPTKKVDVDDSVTAQQHPTEGGKGPEEIPDKPVVSVTATAPPSTMAAPPAAAAQKAIKPVESTDAGVGGDMELRSPILCIMGHVDTGKTKLLDKIRKTNVQLGEAGGITQQIGATFFPKDALLKQAQRVDAKMNLKVPGLLVIDTPGHASFTNLRKRGSSLCDMAILVVDIMHGLEPQTKESIQLLRARKCPFVIALNKVDRLYGWIEGKGPDWSTCQEALKRQKQYCNDEFEKRTGEILVQLAEVGLNCDLYWRVKNVRKYVSVIPTSAITGEGIPDLLTLIVRLTQDVMTKQITLEQDRLECTILEVKTIEGLGTTIDTVLVAGSLTEGDKIVVCGMNGPIVTSIRALLTPQPLKEIRVKTEYVHHHTVKAAMGVKVCAPGLEDAVAGTSVLVIGENDTPSDIEKKKSDVQEDMSTIFKSVDKTQKGVYVMASTLGSLEALLEFLKDSKIPVAGVNIGTVHKLDVKKASVMRERGHEEYAVVLAFDVKVDEEAEKEAKILLVNIMTADIIYHLFDSFTAYLANYKEKKRQENAAVVVFPCVLKILPQFIFNKKDPLVFGVLVEEGELRVGTPLVLPDKEMLKIGRCESIELKMKPVQVAKKGEEVCIKVVGDSTILYGRHFDHTSKIYSHISRQSIDCMKEYFKEDLEQHKRLVLRLKGILGVL